MCDLEKAGRMMKAMGLLVRVKTVLCEQHMNMKTWLYIRKHLPVNDNLSHAGNITLKHRIRDMNWV